MRDLRTSSAIVALVVGGALASVPARAQDENRGGDGASNSAVQDIVVTAQRREQKLQDVPITISAIGASALQNAGVNGTAQLQVAVPNLVVQKALGAAIPFLRGIGFSNGDINAEGSVAIYVDGVYQPNAFANFFSFNDIDRVEVLKGPQGTLFGRNATGGVVQVITRPVSFKPQMNFQVGYANYQTVTADGYISGGITNNLAASIAIQFSNQNDGWGKNLISGKDVYLAREFSTRGKILFEPSDATSLVLSGHYFRFNRNNNAGQNAPGSTLFTGQEFLGKYNVTGNIDAGIRGKGYGGSATLTHDFGGFQIKSITAYQKLDAPQTLDQDLTPLPLVDGDFTQGSRTITQEFHVLSPAAAKFQWLAGLYYFNNKAKFDPIEISGLVFAPLPGIALFTEAKTDSIAAFAQGTYPVATDLNLTLGIRYSKDRSRYTGVEYILGTPVVIDPQQREKYESEKPTWRVSLDHKFTPEILGYVSYNRGVKSGNFSVGTAPSASKPYLPEQLDAFEAGLKTELFDRKVIFNTAAFYYDFKNIQFQRIQQGVVTIVNGPSAKLYGLEADLTARVTPALTITANGSYLHTRLGDFPNAPNTRRLPSGLNDFGDPNFNAGGNRLPNAPEFSGNVGFEYTIPLESSRIRIGSHLLYASKTYTELDNRLQVDNHIILNASMGWQSDSGFWATVWGNNLTKTYYYSMLSGIGGFSDYSIPAAPRTYGISFGYAF